VTALTPEQQAVLDERCREVAADPARIRVVFPAAARDVARTPGISPDPGADRVEDRVRVRMLEALAVGLAHDVDRLVAEVHDLYRHGDADERRAVLLGLQRLGLGNRVTDLLHDALRTNDPRLVAAAMGPCAAHLPAPAWRQGVMKCLFAGVPLHLVSGWDERTDDELVRMVTDFADERRAAGRGVPDDVLTILDNRPPEA
jgi:hypothetical protein